MSDLDDASSVTLRFNARPHHRLLAFGQEIHGGQTFELPEHLAWALAADETNNVSIVEDADTEPEADEGKGQTIDPQLEQED